MPRVTIEFKGDVTGLSRGINQVKSRFDELGTKIDTVSNRMGKRVGKLQKNFDRTLGNMTSSIARFTTAAAALVTGGGLAVATKQAVEFETAITNVGTLLGDSLPLLDDYKKGIQGIATTTSKDLVDLTTGLYDAISAGVGDTNDAGVALDFLNQAQKAAVAGLATTQEAVKAGAIVLNVFGEEAGSVTQIYDKFFQTIRDGVTTFPELSRNLGNVVTAAKNAGVSFDELQTGIAQLTKGGVATSEATTQLRQLFLALAAPTRRVKKRLDELGVTLNVNELRTKGLAASVTNLIEKTKGNLSLLRQTLGSQEALNAALIISKNNGRDFADELGNVAAASGAATEAFDLQAQTIAVQFGMLRNEFSVLSAEVFEELRPQLAGFLRDVREGLAGISATQVAATLSRVGAGLKSILETASTLAPVFLGLFGAKAVASIVGFAVGGVARLVTAMGALAAVVTSLPGLFAAASIAARGFGTAVKAALGPIGLLIIAFEGVAAGIGFVVEEFKSANDELAETNRRAQEIAQNMLFAQRQRESTAQAELRELEVRIGINERLKFDEQLKLQNIKERIEANKNINQLAIDEGKIVEAAIAKSSSKLDQINRRLTELRDKERILTAQFAAGPTRADLPSDVEQPGGPTAGILDDAAKKAEEERRTALENERDMRIAMEQQAADAVRDLVVSLNNFRLDALAAQLEAGNRLREMAREENARANVELANHINKKAVEANQRLIDKAREAQALALQMRQTVADVSSAVVSSLFQGLDGIFSLIDRVFEKMIVEAIEKGKIIKAILLSAGQAFVQLIAQAVQFAGSIRNDPAAARQAFGSARQGTQEASRGLFEQQQALAEAKRTGNQEEMLEAMKGVRAAQDKLVAAREEQADAFDVLTKGQLNVAMEEKLDQLNGFLENVANNFPEVLDFLIANIDKIAEKLGAAVGTIAGTIIKNLPQIIAAGIKAAGVLAVSIVSDFAEALFDETQTTTTGGDDIDLGGRVQGQTDRDPTGGTRGAGGLKPIGPDEGFQEPQTSFLRGGQPTIVFNPRGGAPAVVAKAFAEMFTAHLRREGAPVQSPRDVFSRGVANFPRAAAVVEKG